ncbi:probable uridine nucleosidase 1 [Chiloscyllium plagiosum]|uniref:probable uridine nucleosidase 1 n=1 Tax=Chiloscyllium plagiosum TaxID=36176 RepID=UPI001CB7ECDF|nr:probable uridine nucleosidase 1 [Chiloscyllium plagiosum]
MGCTMGKKLLLLDVDCGVDDAQAMMMALAAPDVHILGITCTHGNTNIENVCKNALRVLQLCNRMEIPVYRGAGTSLLGERLHDPSYHGKDGLGDVPDPNAPGLEHIQAEHAVNAMIRIVNKHVGQVCLVAVGPLTNVALAAKMDPTFPTKLKSLYIMGGNMEGRSPLLKQNTSRSDSIRRERGRELVEFMKNITALTTQYVKDDQGNKELYFGQGFVSCDSYAMAAAIDESVVTEHAVYGVSVELHGALTRGMMVLDTLDLLKLKHKAVVFLKCDMEKFKQLLVNAVK